MIEQIIVSDRELTLQQLDALARREALLSLSDDPAWKRKILEGRRRLEEAAARGDIIYGVSTGVGRTSRRRVPGAGAHHQLNMIRMHGCGLGPHLSEREARAVMVARLISLAKGYSGVRPELLEALARLINSGIAPAIPSVGSVGASGDLTPLSYVGALLLGERDAIVDGRLVPAGTALRTAGIEPFRFEVKEGLALLNGTSAMASVGSLVAIRSRHLIGLAEQATALAIDVVDGRPQAMHPTIHRVKLHPGQQTSAENIRARLGAEGSSRKAEGPSEGREVQDRYCLRCAPQVLGAARDALSWVSRTLQDEINSVSDNPLVDPQNGEILNGGNFYGGHVALAMDCLKTSLATTINLADRQFAFLVSDANPHLPETLLPDEWLPEDQRGLHHGLKALQITVSALTALALQRSSPDAILSRPTESDNQDVVSMGMNASLNARAILEFGEQVMAAWLVALSQAAAIRGEDRLSRPNAELVDRIRSVVPLVAADRPLDRELEALRTHLMS